MSLQGMQALYREDKVKFVGTVELEKKIMTEVRPIFMRLIDEHDSRLHEQEKEIMKELGLADQETTQNL